MSDTRRDLTPPVDVVARLMAEEGLTQEEAVERGQQIVAAAGGTLAPRGPERPSEENPK